MVDPAATDTRRAQPTRIAEQSDDAVLAERARRLARPFETEGRGEVASQLLGLDAGEARFALPIASVAIVLSPVRPTPIPGTPAWLAGAISVRGQVVAVVEPDRFLGAPAELDQPADRLTVAVISVAGSEIGLLVDQIGRIEDAGGVEVHPLPDGTPELVVRAVRGTVAGRHLLDVEGLIAAIDQTLRPSTDDPHRRQGRRVKLS